MKKNQNKLPTTLDSTSNKENVYLQQHVNALKNKQNLPPIQINNQNNENLSTN